MGKAAYKCCVKGCTNIGGISHRFPNPRKNLQLQKKWIQLLGSDEFKGLSPNDIYYKKRICSIHFSSNCYSAGTKVLNFNAVPSLNLMVIDEISSTDTNETNNCCNLAETNENPSSTCSIKPTGVSVDDQSIKVKSIYQSFMRTQRATVSFKSVDALKLLERELIKVMWISARVKLKVSSIKRFRCLGYDHTRYSCKRPDHFEVFREDSYLMKASGELTS
ncbi:Zinc finger, C2CH-type [Cinara cedri]|uniref:Zinc finger, C2CH-type n=1 Tax=Cinara cedri TaxID=506608 RepID=A0A5E4MI66_9HEMI|nr:Zinc finger, C2CH-type [Cinara cedri]